MVLYTSIWIENLEIESMEQQKHSEEVKVKKTYNPKNVKLQYQNRQLVQIIIELINANEHDSLAYLARTTGIPPQLRYLVWPILLKYHPMCISPNIISNTIAWNQETNGYEFSTQDKQDVELESLIKRDLAKYFHIRKNSAEPSKKDSDCIDDLETIELLKEAILLFLQKWSKVFSYEPGLAWIAVGLAEWFPPFPQDSVAGDDNDDNDGPVLLNAKKYSSGKPTKKEDKDIVSDSTNKQTDSPNQELDPSVSSSSSSSKKKTQRRSNYLKLFKEYPLPSLLKSQLPTSNVFNFNQMYERLLLVVLHSPDTLEARANLINHLKADSSKDTTNNIYFPILSGGSLSFQMQLFFKVFSTILPELYQPLTEEIPYQQTVTSRSWLYWWLKFSGARTLHKQDRARVWDLLLGWRPKPKMDSINFYLNYNNKKFDHLYSDSFSSNVKFLKSIRKDDPFWFPDLDSIPIGDENFLYDYDVFKQLLILNKFDKINTTNDKETNTNEEVSDIEDNKIPFSLIDPHIQLIFVYIAILQYNEFKLLEFEETEITEFLNNVPLLSKADDVSFKKIRESNKTKKPRDSDPENQKINIADYNPMDQNVIDDLRTLSRNSETSTSTTIQTPTETKDYQDDFIQVPLPTAPVTNHMHIEVGNDAKASNSFNNILQMAGDIWRKWLWHEIEDTSSDDLFNFVNL